MAKTGKPPTTFDELMSTPIDFSAYVLHNLKIENLTQEHLVGPTFNLLKGTCKSRVELEFHFEECYKAVTDKLDWHNPEGHEYPFDLSKPLPLIEDQGRQVVPANYFFNNDPTDDQYCQHLIIFRLYTSSLLNVACKKALNLLKKGLLVWGEAKATSKWRLSRWTTSYKMVRIRYSFPRSSQNQRDLPRDIPLVSVEVHKYDIKKSKSDNKGKVLIEMELVLEQTQQGTSHEVSISTEGVEELKEKLR
ncbi:hypothetical protein Tco_0700685 [Tanacetum coccineum]